MLKTSSIAHHRLEDKPIMYSSAGLYSFAYTHPKNQNFSYIAASWWRRGVVVASLV